MRRRSFLQATAAATFTSPILAAVRAGRWDAAAEVLTKATDSKQVHAATLYVSQKDDSYTRHFGQATTGDAMFLLGSISKPINITAVMTLYDQGKFQLEDRVKKFLPTFTGGGRDDVTIRHLLTHVSGLPDQLASNNELRKRHASLTEFSEQTLRTPLSFAPGTKYQYSSMGILLATRIAELISGTDILTLVDRSVLQPLGMKHSAQGVGRFQLTDLLPCQMDGAAPESGSGDPQAKDWNWNSPYWRKLGAPWGGTHASAPDVGRFLAEFMDQRNVAIKPATARLMLQNHNPAGFTPRGLGFHVGAESGSKGCSDQTFGHTGSTGTLCWADPQSKTICVVLTTLPRRAVQPHPREVAANYVAAAVR
ncbi:Esterase EstB [Anatilimnocola aggregata]|uniref:Esterase EstB n=1 Tax=Anatilimnocola aggregata TaxID=2528021 RepID=A0A517YCM5_9BACT|nr:serine hydrolase domain-containing protein [Anatilimnocola aggregata]QDU27995.1 Esterase EstB [Anatilimnocola aggregata]